MQINDTTLASAEITLDGGQYVSVRDGGTEIAVTWLYFAGMSIKARGVQVLKDGSLGKRERIVYPSRSVIPAEILAAADEILTAHQDQTDRLNAR